MNHFLVIEDDPGIRESLEDFLASNGERVTAVENLDAARNALKAGPCTMILLDLMLPDGDGLDLLRETRRKGDQTPVIILTARGEEEQRVLGLKAGADDYLVKPFGLQELQARIEAVLRRTGSAATAIRIGDAEVDVQAHEVRHGGTTHKLVQKEAELIAFLIRNPGRAFRREEILRAVWGYDSAPTTRTVDTHVFNLRRKIEPEPEKPRHLITVHGVGYRLSP